MKGRNRGGTVGEGTCRVTQPVSSKVAWVVRPVIADQ